MPIKDFLSEYGIDISRSRGPSINDREEYPSYYWGLDEKYSQAFINVCYQERVPIIGIDILIKGNNSYPLLYDIWSYQRKDDEDFDSYLRNSIQGAMQYITFNSQKRDILFSFTLGRVRSIFAMTINNYLSEYGIDISRSRGSSIHNREDYPSYYWGLDEKSTEDFINVCFQERVPITGIDILIKENDSYTLSYDIWCYQRKGDEDFDSYLRNSIQGAKQYIKHFSQKGDILFSFSLGHIR